MLHTFLIFQADLLELLTKDAKLLNLLNTGYSVFGNPLMVFNHRGEVLSISDHQPYHDADWEEAERSCFYAKDKFSCISSYNFSKNSHLLLNEKNSTHRRLVTKIPGISDGIYLALLESEHPFAPSDPEMVLILAQAISIKLRKRKRSSTLWIDTHELFISNLLQGKILEESTARDYARNFAIRPKGSITLLTARSIIELGENDIQKFSLPILELLPESRTTIYKGDLIILVMDQTKLERGGKTMGKLDGFFRRNQMQCCVGLPVEAFLDLKEQYEQTSVTLNLCANLKIRDTIVFYEQYAVQNLLNEMEEHEREMFCHPGVLKLRELDKKRGSSFLSTLYAYAMMYGNHSDAAKLLQISPNTLKYRLRSINAHLGEGWERALPVYYLSMKALFLIEPKCMAECKPLEQVREEIRR